MNEPIKASEFKNPEFASPAPVSIPLEWILGALRSGKKAIAAGLCLGALVGLGFGFFKPTVFSAVALYRVGQIEREFTPARKAEPQAAQAPTDTSTAEIQETRLIQSPAVAEAVVRRFNLHAPKNSFLSSIRTSLFGERSEQDRISATTRALLERLTVRNEPRSNLVNVSITADTSERAAAMANAIVEEYVQDRRRTAMAGRLAVKRLELSNELLTYGERHPEVISARANVAAIEKAAEALRHSSPQSAAELAASGLMDLARSDTRPVGLTLINCLGLGAFVGLLAGLGIALASAYFDWRHHHTIDRFLNSRHARFMSVGVPSNNKTGIG